MQIILLIGVFQAFFIVMLILQKKKKALHHKILAAWLIYLGLFTGVYAFYANDLFDRFPLLTNIYFSLFLLHGPFLYFYTISLISEKKRIFRIGQLGHFAPVALFNIYLIVAFQFPETARNLRIDHVHIHIDPPWHYAAFLLLIAFSGPPYFVWTSKMLRRHSAQIKNKYSSTENIDLKWLRNLILVFGIAWTALMAFAIVHHVVFLFTPDFCTNGLFLSLTGFIILTGYFGLKQSIVVTPETAVPGAVKKPRYAGSSLTGQKAAAYREKLEAFMQKEKPFLINDITLQSLAEMVDMPPHYLSQVVNETYDQNFFDYINSRRVEEVIRKLKDPKYDAYSLLGIAMDSGFNSKTAFNRVFRKQTGMTPGEYKKQMSWDAGDKKRETER